MGMLMKALRNLLLILLWISFYATIPLKCEAYASNDKEELKQVASTYWKSRLTGDVVICYQLEEPAFRKKVPLSQYARGGSVIYKTVNVDDIDIQGNIGRVKVKISFIIPAIGSSNSLSDTVVDKWKKVDGKWYHIMRQESPVLKKIAPKKNQKERR